MRLVLVGDIQMHIWRSYPECNEEGVNLRLLDTFNELDRIRKMCVKNGVDAVCILGDIFEARNELNVSVINMMLNALEGFVDSDISVIVLVGNHDRTGVGKEHALEMFRPFCEIVDQPRTIKLDTTEVVALPYFPNAKTTVRAIEQFVTPRTKLLLGHTAIQSLKMPNGELWGQGIHTRDIPKHVKAVFGHFHRFTEVVPGRVYFLGSMIQVDRSDAGIDKFFAVYDSEKHHLDFHPTRGPKFVAVDVPSMHPNLLEEIKPIIVGNFVTVKSIPTGIEDVGLVERTLIEMGARHVELSYQLPITPPPQSLVAAVQGVDHIEIIRHYVEDTETTLNKEELTDVGIEIATEADGQLIMSPVVDIQ